MQREIQIHMTTYVNGEMQEPVREKGIFMEKNGQFLIRFTDSAQVNTSIKLEKEGVHLFRRSTLYSTKLPVRAHAVTKGHMDATPFSIHGKQLTWTVDEKGGRADVEYLLPDLSDERMHFQIQISFFFL